MEYGWSRLSRIIRITPQKWEDDVLLIGKQQLQTKTHSSVFFLVQICDQSEARPGKTFRLSLPSLNSKPDRVKKVIQCWSDTGNLLEGRCSSRAPAAALARRSRWRRRATGWRWWRRIQQTYSTSGENSFDDARFFARYRALRLVMIFTVPVLL